MSIDYGGRKENEGIKAGRRGREEGEKGGERREWDGRKFYLSPPLTCNLASFSHSHQSGYFLNLVTSPKIR